MRPTMTGVQANARVEQILTEAANQLPAGSTRKPFGSTGFMPCDDPTDGGPAGRVFAELHYQLEFPADWPVDQALPALARYWDGRDYRVVRDDRDRDDPSLYVENRGDGFRVGIEVFPRDNGRTDIYLVGSSPCVWEHGTPQPE